MSDIKSILLHLDSSDRSAERTRIAARLAEAFDAKVSAVYSVTPSLSRYPMGSKGPAGGLGLQQYDDACRDKANRLFKVCSSGSGHMEWDEVVGDAIAHFERRAVYADLLVLGQRNDEAPAARDTPADFVFRQIIGSGHPALLVPFAGTFPTVGRTVLIAWKETREAARAVGAALPWLRNAQGVHAISYGEDAATQLQSLQQYLSAHQVKADLHQGNFRDVDVGEDLKAKAAYLGADLLVTGCYGHSRAREWVMGGVSRTMLHTTTVPLLLAH
jgi:nucleotide-binding universal stress UspA family protein